MNLSDYRVIECIKIYKCTSKAFEIDIDIFYLGMCMIVKNDTFIIYCNKKYYLFNNFSYGHRRHYGNDTYRVIFNANETSDCYFKDITINYNRFLKINKILS